MLFLTVFLGVAVNLLLCAFAPLRAAFGIVPLTGAQWGLTAAASLAVVPLAELYKAIVRRAAKREQNGRRAPLGAVQPH